MTGILLKDVYSSVKKDKLYGTKGSKVTIITQRDTITIVENDNGRFAVQTKHLTIIN